MVEEKKLFPVLTIIFIFFSHTHFTTSRYYYGGLKYDNNISLLFVQIIFAVCGTGVRAAWYIIIIYLWVYNRCLTHGYGHRADIYYIYNRLGVH